ncbi:MAG: hypothetical protein ACQPRJ_05735 [Solitalea-like symbiont of Acarus siro]
MIKLIKSLFGILVLFVAYYTSSAQVPSYYSMNALGLPINSNNVRSISMGGVYNSLIDPFRVNYNNPASYAEFLLTNFDISGSFIANSIANNNTAGSLSAANLNAISIGFPIKPNKIGLAVGLQPYSYMNYNAFNKEPIGGTNVDVGMKGYGSYSTAFIGLGFRIIDNLLIGFNFNYLFGKIEKSRYLYFSAPHLYNSKTFIDIDASGMFFNYGLSYIFNINEKDKILLSYSSDVGSKINTTEDLISGSYINVNNNEVIIDSVSSVINNHNSFILPFKHTLGVMYEADKYLRFGADFSLQDWSNIKYKPFDEIASGLVFLKDQQLSSSYRLSLGAEYIPNVKSPNKYYQKIEYRLGVKLEKLNINVNSNSVNAVSFNAGLGLPIDRQLFSTVLHNISYLNIGLGITRQGSISKNLVQETYFNLYIGFNIANKWFIQRKYD